MRSPEDRRVLWLIILITLLGFAVRVIHLGGDSFWFDELWTLSSTRDDVAKIAAGQDLNNPPGYYLLAYAATQLAGTSEYALRFPSALAGTLAIPFLYVLGSVITNRRVALWAALLLAVSPFHLRYSQEARAYALQMMLTTASSACLLLALLRRKHAAWLGFGIATALNAYVQFSSFIVLGSQLVFAGLYALFELLQKRWTVRQLIVTAAGGAASLVLVLLLYSPYLNAALAGVSANLGPRAWAAGRLVVTLQERIGAAYLVFGFNTATLAALTGVLALGGFVSALVRRRADQIAWMLCSLLLPFIVIAAAGVSRAPLPKNVLFVLPAYVATVALGWDAVVTGIAQRLKARHCRAARLVPAVAALLVLAVGVPSVLAEHAHTEEDWRSIAAYLQRSGDVDPVVIPITLDLPDGFNQGFDGMRHYLPQYLTNYHLLEGEHLTDPRVADLAGLNRGSGDVWFVVLKRDVPLSVAAADAEVLAFQGGTYLLHLRRAGRQPVDSMIAFYPALIAQARTPCYLWFDLARLLVQADRHDDAATAMAQAPTPCPGSLGIRRAIYQQLVEHYLQRQQNDRAREIALKILALDAKDKLARAALTAEDLSDLFQRGAPAVSALPSPARPIDIQRFTMPQNGDWGDALVMQTPARLIFRLQLPAEPVSFVSRIAMSPDSWDWGGDGARFSVSVMDAVGAETIVFDRYVSNQEPDRTWHDVEVPLRQFTGQTITLTLATDPGLYDDTTGDWAGWETPRIVYAGAP